MIIIIMYENTKHVKLSTILFFIQDCEMLVKLIRFNFQNLKEENILIHVKLALILCIVLKIVWLRTYRSFSFKKCDQFNVGKLLPENVRFVSIFLLFLVYFSQDLLALMYIVQKWGKLFIAFKSKQSELDRMLFSHEYMCS